MDYNLLDRGFNGTLKKHQKQSPQGVIVVYGDVCLGFNGEIKEMTHEMFSMLDGIVLFDAMGDLDEYQSKIDEIADHMEKLYRILLKQPDKTRKIFDRLTAFICKLIDVYVRAGNAK